MQTITQDTYPALAKELQSINRIGVLVSGGCDSEVLLRAAADVLGSASTIAFTAVTPFIAKYYTEIVKASAKELNIKLIQVLLDPLEITHIKANTAMRCYHCKKAIYSTIKAEALKESITILADGTNLDDIREHRPGLQAASELNIQHPFKNAGMNKEDIRNLGRLLNMSNPERPSDSCLATRIPEQIPITESTLSLISAVEQPLRPLVKGRLRARISDKQITLDHQSIDKELVKAQAQALQAIASESGYSLCFHEISFSRVGNFSKHLLYPYKVSRIKRVEEIKLRFLNWPHAIIGFLIGVALILYVRGESEEEVDVSVQNSPAVAEVQAE